MEKIDFVILWVDGSDPAWLEQKNHYHSEKYGNAFVSGASRYQDWEQLPYWFRGIEKYAPWVNRIFFVTWGHVPSWLNLNHPKLTVVKHSEFIPHEYLPTFNSNTILLNLHRIPGLSEQFVVFNDDMFLMNPVVPKDFFQNGLPLDECVHNALVSPGGGDMFPHFLMNNMDVINRHFSKRQAMRKNLSKHFNLRYGAGNIRTLALLPWWGFTGFYNHHVSCAYRKQTFEEVWEKEFPVLDVTCRCRFRDYNNVTEWLMRYWQLAKGEFVPRPTRFGVYYGITDDNRSLADVFGKSKAKVCCVNDEVPTRDFEATKKQLLEIFENFLPTPCSFEK